MQPVPAKSVYVLILGALFSGVVLPSGHAQAQAEDSNANKLLQQCISLTELVERIQFKCAMDLVIKGGSPPEIPHQNAEFTLSRYGDLFDVTGRFGFVDSKVPPFFMRNVLNAHVYASYTYKYEQTNRPKGGVGSWQLEQQIPAFLGFSFSLEGFFVDSGRQSIYKLLLEAPDLRISNAPLPAGGNGVLLAGSSRYGKMTALLDAKRPYPPIRLELIKDATSLATNFKDPMPLGEQKWRFDDKDHIPSSSVTRISEIKAESIQGKPIAIGGRYLRELHFTDGLSKSWTYTYTRKDVRLITAQSELPPFETDLPDGVSVTNMDDPSGIEYVWDHGDMKKAYGDFNPENTAFSRPSTRRLLLGIALTVSLALPILVVYLRRRRGRA